MQLEALELLELVRHTKSDAAGRRVVSQFENLPPLNAGFASCLRLLYA
jgi:hypothetical protein